MINHQDVEDLIRKLETGDLNARVEAAWALGELKNPKAVKPLIEALKDGNWRVRWRAAWALGEIKDPRAVPPLIDALRDEDSRVRESAARALGEIGDRRAVEPLIWLLRDEDSNIREEAAKALGSIGDRRAVEPLIDALRDEDSRVRESAARALGEIGDRRAVRHLVEALRDGGWAVRESAVKALGRLGRRGVDHLIRELGNADPRIREGAARALGEIGDRRAVEPLIGALEDRDPRVRRMAAHSLGVLMDRRAVKPLIRCLKDEDSGVRREAAWALGKLGSRRAVEPLIERLGDEDAEVREEAAESLGKIGDRRAIGPLVNALKDEHWLVRVEAAESLGEIGDRRAVDALVEALKDEEWEVRERATWALGELGGRRAVEALVGALGDEEWEVRRNAADALRKIGKPAVKHLIQALEDENPSVREGAAIALGKIGDERAVEPLMHALRDEDSGVRERASGALREMGKGVKRIGEYGVIGDLRTCVLVGVDGSIDWCCLPYVESPSVFAAILDPVKGGCFAIHPSGSFESEQRYVEDTNVLQTVFRTRTGVVVLTDFMSVAEMEGAPQGIFRRVTCEEGVVELEVKFKPRFNYARVRTSIERVEGGVLARGGGEWVFLTSQVPVDVADGEARGRFTVKQGEELWFALHYRGDKPVDLESCAAMLENTIRYWREWVRGGRLPEWVVDEDWRSLVRRSALVLKLLTHPSGAIYAAPTTSLPERVGASLNWDYRFAWIRDASFTVQAFYNLGYVEEAKRHLKWLIRICEECEDPSEIQPLYGLYGELDLKETVLSHLSGYRGSKPVRIGNEAARQRQLDIYGELVNAVYEVTRYGEEISKDAWEFVKRTVDYVCKVWNTPDAGIWEFRGEPRHHVYSKLMCWVALDRGIKIAKRLGDHSRLERWIEARDEVKNAILERGFNRRLGSFVQHFDSDVLDASCLLVPVMGLLPFSDYRVQGTINAVMRRLMPKEGLVYRFEASDEFYRDEGAFILCSFWLVYALALSGRIEEAERVFRSVLRYASPLGLFSEEVDPRTGEQLGNFPQAYSHIGLINSVLYISMAKRGKHMKPEPLGFEAENA